MHDYQEGVFNDAVRFHSDQESGPAYTGATATSSTAVDLPQSRPGEPCPANEPRGVGPGHLMPLDVSSLFDRWIALCFPGSLHSGIAASVNRQAEVLAREGVAMAVVLSDARLFRLSERQDLPHITAPIVTDPLRRLHRWYGVHRHVPFSDLSTFIIDPGRILRFTFEQALDGRECEILRHVMGRTSNTGRTDHESTTSRKEGSHALCSCS